MEKEARFQPLLRLLTKPADSTKQSWRANPGLKILFLGLGTIVIAAAAWFLSSRPVSVRAVRPQRGEIIAEIFGTGTLESKVAFGVSSKITGKVVEVLADQGDQVTSGQILARLEDKDFMDAVRVADAQRNQAAATLEKAKLDFDRQRWLLAKKLVARADFDAAETAYRVAQAQAKAAGDAQGVARAKLADTQIISPDPGLVVTRNLEVGSTVVPGAPIFRIATSVPWVAAQVDERITADLRTDQPARVIFATDPTNAVTGHVARRGVEVDRVTEELEVDIALDKLPINRFLGQRADVYIETGRQPNALHIPVAALVTQDGRVGVFIIEGHRARWRPVQLGLRGRESVEIKSGLKEQELVIQNPLLPNPIHDGTRVSVSKDKNRGHP